MKGIAIGFSDTSKEILKRLKKTEFINEVYIGSSSQKEKYVKDTIEVLKPKKILKPSLYYTFHSTIPFRINCFMLP